MTNLTIGIHNNILSKQKEGGALGSFNRLNTSTKVKLTPTDLLPAIKGI